MSYRLSTPLLPGAYHFGGGGLGILGAVLLLNTAGGDVGGGIMANDGLLPDREYRAVVSSDSFAPGAWWLGEDGAGWFSGSGGFTYSLYEDGVLAGSASVSALIPWSGALVPLPCAVSVGSGTGVVTLSDAASSGSEGGWWMHASPRVRSISPGRGRVQAFSEKGPLEIVFLVFDFGLVEPAPVGAVVRCSQYGGSEADPAADGLPVGSPSIVGATVVQRVSGGLVGVDYLVTCQVDSPDGSRFQLSGVLPVRVI